MSQSLMFPPKPAASKFAATYEFAAPECEEKTPGFPWNQSVVPVGELLFTTDQPLGIRFATLSKFSRSSVVADAGFGSRHTQAASSVAVASLHRPFLVREVPDIKSSFAIRKKRTSRCRVRSLVA